MSAISLHSSATIAEAQRMAAAGWTAYAIAQVFARRDGPSPDERTVRTWIDEKYAEKRRAKQAQRYRVLKAKRSRGRLGAGPPRSPEFRMERMRSLRALGIAFDDIAKAMTFDFPREPVSGDQVRYALRNDSIPKAYRGAGLRERNAAA